MQSLRPDYKSVYLKSSLNQTEQLALRALFTSTDLPNVVRTKNNSIALLRSICAPLKSIETSVLSMKDTVYYQPRKRRLICSN